MKVRNVFSASEIDRIIGLQPVERRMMVKTGILNPARTKAGHAIFGDDDVEAGRAFKTAQRAARKTERR